MTATLSQPLEKYEDFTVVPEETTIEVLQPQFQLKCGEVLLMENEWKILFKCELCDCETTSFANFLEHSLHHHLLVSAESIEELVQQAMLKDDPPTAEEVQTNETSQSLSESEICDLYSEQMTDEEGATEELCIEVLNDGQSEQNTACDYLEDDEQTTDFNDTVANLMEEALRDEDDGSTSDRCSANDDDRDDEDNNDAADDVMVDQTEDNSENHERTKRQAPAETETGTNIFTCELCGKRIRWRDRYELHMRRHNGIKPYECEFCGATFADTSNCNTHRKRHLGIKPHICNICQKGFTASTDLTRHQRTHTGERPYMCTDCDRGFKTMALLNVHRRRHSNIRPYICATCGKGFFESNHLKDHEISHTNERPFSCTLCGAKFGRRKALLQHLKLHSSVKEYRCDQCGKEFSQKAGLISHQKIHLRSEAY